MRIARIYTTVAVMSKDHKFSFDHTQHKLEFIKELGMFSIDERVLIPLANIREVVYLEESSERKEGESENLKPVSPVQVADAPNVIDNYFGQPPIPIVKQTTYSRKKKNTEKV